MRVWSLLAILWLWPGLALAQGLVMELSLQDQASWSYVSDQVMGGVSEGQARLEGGVLRLTGDVSTANRGGFIQARTRLETTLPDTAQGVVLQVRGNDQTYFVHLRTRGTALPWQYYQAEFQAGSDWQEVRLPFSAFKPSGGLLRNVPRAASVESLGIVAYGRDHQADVRVRAVGFY